MGRIVKNPPVRQGGGVPGAPSMENNDLTDEVVRFVTNRIDTVPHLEALLLLRDHAPRAWSESEIASRLYVPAAAARKILQDLQRSLLAAEAEGAWTFAADAALAASVDEVAKAYRTRLSSVAYLIHSKGSPAMREFSRAFKLKDG